MCPISPRPLTDATPGTRTHYEITVRNPDRCSEAVTAATFDDTACTLVGGTARVPLVRDGRTHRLDLILGRRMETAS